MKTRSEQLAYAEIWHGALKKAFASLVLCCLATHTWAQATLESDSNYVETGNPFVLHLRLPVSVGRPGDLNFDAWAPVLPAQNIISQSDWQNEGQFYHKILSVLFFDEDTIEIPPLPIALFAGDSAFTNPLKIVVTATPSPEDLNDMAPIKDIHREATRWTDYLPWALGALAVLGLIMWLNWFTKQRRKARIQSRAFETPPHELAWRKLNALTKKDWLSRGMVKEHYAELTFILREYLEKRFGIPALESTSEETLGLLKNQGVPESVSTELKELLEQADLAKFAKTIPPESFHSKALESSRNIILETSPQETPMH